MLLVASSDSDQSDISTVRPDARLRSASGRFGFYEERKKSKMGTTTLRVNGSQSLLRIMMLLLVMMMPFMVVTSAHAEGDHDVNATLNVGKDQGGIGGVADAINDGTDTTILDYDSAEGVLTFNNKEYSKMDNGERRDYMKAALGAIRKSELSTMAKNRMYNFVADQDKTTTAALRNLQTDSQADVASATTWFRPFSGIVSTILGLLTLVVFIFLAVSTVFDTAYITIPVFRMFTMKDNGKPFFITTEAYSAINDTEGSNDGKYRTPLGLYFRRRAWIMVLIGVCLLYLISGQIFDLIIFLIDAFAPLTDQLSPK